MERHIRTSLKTLLVVAVCISAVVSAHAETLYQNDFGTAAQRAEMTVSGGEPTWTQIDPAWDRTGDGLAYYARRVGYGMTTMTRRIVVPKDKVLSYPSFSCYAAGYPYSWGTGVNIRLSVDGVNWDHVESLLVEGFGGTQVTVSAAGDLRYRNLTSVWIKAEVYDYGGNNPTETNQSKVWDFLVTGTLTDDLSYKKTGLYAWTSCPGRVAYDKVIPGGERSCYYPGLISVPIIYPFDTGFTWSLATCLANTDAMMSALDPSVTKVILGEENIWWGNAPTILNGIYDHIKANYPGVQVYQWFSPSGGQYSPVVIIKADGWVMDDYGFTGPNFRKYMMTHVATGKPVITNCMWASAAGGGFGGWSEMSPITQGQLTVCNEFNISPMFFAVDWATDSVYGWLTTSNPDVVVWRNWLYGSSYNYGSAPCTIGGAALACENTNVSVLPAASANNSTGSGIAVTQAGTFVYTDDYSTTNFVLTPNLGGFLNLRAEYIDGKLITEPKIRLPNLVNMSTLTYRFYSSPSRTLKTISANITGQIRGSGTQVRIDMSTNGTTWQKLQSQSGTAGTTSNFNKTSTGGSLFQGTTFYVRIRSTVPASGDAWVSLDNLQVNYTAL